MLESEFLDKMLNAFSKLREEISEEGGEFDFRYSLSTHLIGDALGWSRKKGEGHFEVEKERKDIRYKTCLFCKSHSFAREAPISWQDFPP